MDSICRLCCSTKFVNNYLFDEENALYLKMELYLPIKIRKLDRLPQRVCDRCSCRVNDLYQFCNEAIEAQHRLSDMLRHMEPTLNEASIDLTFTKQEVAPPHLPELQIHQPLSVLRCEQSTQTDFEALEESAGVASEVKIKDEQRPFTPPLVKKEDNESIESDHNEVSLDAVSDNSEDNISLVSLKKKKKSRKPSTNGELPRRGRKKKKLDEWQILINSLPESESVKIVDKPEVPVALDAMKEEMDFDFPEATDMRNLVPVEVKKEPGEMHLFQCCICFTQCLSKSEMLTHYKAHVSSAEARAEAPAAPPPPAAGPLRCVRCKKVVEPSKWARHWARHCERDVRPYRCSLCEKTFRNPQQILKHGETHQLGEGGEGGDVQKVTKRFVCDLCPEVFVYMRYLLSHRARAHPEAAMRALALRCVVCARTFAHINSLRRHLRAHSGERNYLCNVCGKALSSREYLKFHIRIHTGYKPNVCKTCGKAFAKKCNLTLHERVHSGEKPHVCSRCGKAFSQRSTLVIHERYHTGARPYVCALCGRGFVAKGLLSTHLKTTCI